MLDTTYLALAEGTNTDTPGDVFGVWSKPLSRELSFGRYVHVRCQEPYAPILTDPKILQRLEIGNSKSPIHPDALLQSEQFLLGKDSILAKPRWPLRLQAGGLLYLVGGYPGYILTIARTDGVGLVLLLVTLIVWKKLLNRGIYFYGREVKVNPSVQQFLPNY